MPGAGTDRTQEWPATGGPVVILVEPQLGENIGACARAMANFGLRRLRLVKPRDGWPNPYAQRSAAGADVVLEGAELFDTLKEAIADCTLLLATTAREHGQVKPVLSPEQAAFEMRGPIAAGETVGLIFGRERNGLENDEIALADKIVTLPVNPAFSSLNLAQAVLVLAYEWFKLASGSELPFKMNPKSGPAPKQQLHAFFEGLEKELERVDFFRPPEKREVMTINLRNLIHRMSPNHQDVQTLHGIVRALVEGRKGPAEGGILRGGEAELLRELLNKHAAQEDSGTAPGKGLARLLRRNPTQAEKILWKALSNDRRFAGVFKRNVPIGPQVADFLAQPLRLLLEILPDDEPAAAKDARAAKRAWLEARNYRMLDIPSVQVERNLAALLERIALEIEDASAPK